MNDVSDNGVGAKGPAVMLPNAASLAGLALMPNIVKPYCTIKPGVAGIAADTVNGPLAGKGTVGL